MDYGECTMNNEYEITITEPLLRPGLKLKTTCSERYAVRVMNKLMDIIREFNAYQEEETS